ncbi:MFS transporter, YNFM family, putative membrane transport protein [Thiothrix eikelboomii]|uniref:MFS transporter, YNFM family, putative membrane transport protein n=1 Tax=Thiothrix eikelboomii TaxID=92487 RepID=A0A1T4Y5Y6_9GAMM|nr:MFS transporter [Thiothrix eikelboomii]SKA97156.1 MFS transporter, YNFM family, putative membrane transport protein [Thiothrix eikelboomii]
MMITTGTRDFWYATLALALGSFMIFANVHMTQPLLPQLAATFELTPLQASWSLTATLSMLGLSLLIYGPLSDAWGRKNLMSISLLGAVFTTLAISQVETYSSLLILRGLQGLFLGGLPAIAIAYMGDEFERHAVLVAVGLYISANSLGGVTGRLVSGFVGEHYDWQIVFLVLGSASFILVLLFIWLLPSSKHFQAQPLHPRSVVSDLKNHLRNPLLLTAYLIGGLNMLVFLTQYSYITFVLADAPYHLSTHALGMLFLTYLTGSLASAGSGRAALWLSQPLCMILGILLLITGSLFTLLAPLPMIVSGFLISSFGFFLTHSTLSSWVSQHALTARASASSLYLVFYYLGASLGSFYLEPFWQWAGWPGVVSASLLVFAITLSAAVWLSFRHNERVQKSFLANA